MQKRVFEKMYTVCMNIHSSKISELHHRHIIEIITVFVALVMTFYAGYSLGHDHGADDKVKINSQQTSTVSPAPRVLYSTSTLKELINNAPAVAVPN